MLHGINVGDCGAKSSCSDGDLYVHSRATVAKVDDRHRSCSDFVRVEFKRSLAGVRRHDLRVRAAGRERNCASRIRQIIIVQPVKLRSLPPETTWEFLLALPD